MSKKVKLIDKNSGWGGVLNLTLGATMTTEKCLEIVKKLDDVSQNKFYTINVYDTVVKAYMGDSELFIENNRYRVRHAVIRNELISYYNYVFNFNGTYSRSSSNVSLSDILSRLSAIEQHLGL